METKSNVSEQLTITNTLDTEGGGMSHTIVIDATGETFDLGKDTETNSKLCDLPQDFVLQEEVKHNGR